MQKTMTEYRWNVLVDIVDKKGDSPPGGYRNAGAHARHWWAAVAWLRTNGYVQPMNGNSYSAYATDEGKRLVREWHECHEPTEDVG